MEWKKNITNTAFMAVIGVDMSGLVFGISIMTLLDPNTAEWSKALAHLLVTPSATFLLALSLFLIQKFHSEKRGKDLLDVIQNGNKTNNDIRTKLESFGDIKASLASIDNTQKAAVQTQKDIAGILKNMVSVLKDISSKL